MHVSPERSTNNDPVVSRITPSANAFVSRRLWVWLAGGTVVATLVGILLVVLLRGSGSFSSHQAPIGVVECDEYLSRMEACTSKLDASLKPQAAASLAEKHAAWETAAASGGASKDALKSTCQAELGTMPIVCGPIGIWECDTYLLKMEACVERMDPAAKSTSETSFKQTRAAWQAAVRSGADRELLRQGCEAAVAAIPPTCK